MREEEMVGWSGRVGRIAKVFAFGIELTPEIASSKKLHTRKPAWPPGRIFLQRRTCSWLPSYSDLAETSPFRLPRLFSALPWVILGALQGAKVNLLSFFAGFAHFCSSISSTYLPGSRQGRRFAPTI